jgi:hypothetical protein
MQVTNNVTEASDDKDLTLKAADTQLGMSTMTAPAGKGEGSNNKRNLKYETFTSSPGQPENHGPNFKQGQQ